ncbi:MAG: LON peptidase substrate-binding domain-containing protein [Beijerinckiaceae bacterium]|nr:LON peptidase substrate-binding domain-containing protein [Beijerinckiaceae bacterium]
MPSSSSTSGLMLPDTLPLFPLPGALLLPRGQMPLNIFEPRYLAMVDAALAGSRMIGMIQPDPGVVDRIGLPQIYAVGCAGRITQFAETGDGRYLIQLTGTSRFRIVEELSVITPFRQAQVDFTPYSADRSPGAGENEVNREGMLAALRKFSDANKVPIDWSSIEQAGNEALVNGLSMMSPYGVREKQALLEAETLKDRAEMLIAITEMDIARKDGDEEPRLQ